MSVSDELTGMNRKIIAASLLLVLLSNVVSAVATSIYPNYGGQPGHFYQVIFDGEGEAAVVAKIVQPNTGKNDLDKIELEIPGRVNARYIFQEIPSQACDNRCVRYDNVCAKTETVCTRWDAASKTCASWDDRCTQYSTTCAEYPARCYDSYERAFVPLDFKEEQLSWSKKLTVNLSKPVDQGKSVTVIIYYKAMGYTQKDINFNFDFETIKSSLDTPYLRVAVDVDGDLSLRGGETKTSYIPNLGSFNSLAAKKNVALTGEHAGFVRGLSDNVIHAGGYVKTKSNLDPWESFHVTGRYNEKGLWFLNYYEEAGIFVAVLLGINFLMRGGLAHALSGFIKRARKSSVLRIILAGLASAVFVAISVAAVIFVGSILSSLLRNAIAGILVLIVGIVTMLLSVAFPVYYFSHKYSDREGVAVLVSTMAWLVVIAFVISALPGNGYYTIMSVVSRM